MPPFVGRSAELGALRSALDRTVPSIVRVTGVPGSGRTTLVRRACEGGQATHVHVPPLPDPLQRRALAREAGLVTDGDPPGWEAIFEAATATSAPRRPGVLVLDDAHHLTDARARIQGPLTSLLRGAGDGGRPVHVVLVGPAERLPVGADDGDVALDLPVGPLDLRAAQALLPGDSPEDVIRAYALFGGIPGRLRLVDASVGWATNLRRLVLEPEAPLARAGLHALERATQTPSRYAAILQGLAFGEASWAEVHAAVPDLTASGQVAPYLGRLEGLGQVETRRSLDARPGGRSRRYRIRDPFDAFWFRFVLPELSRLERGLGDAVLAETVRPAIDDHVATVLPDVCRTYMASHVMERAGTNARENGSLWGAGYDLPVAGVLRAGPAFYGACRWAGRAGVQDLQSLEGGIAATRYGFGRETRLRILFAAGGFSPELARSAARRHDLMLVDAAALVGVPPS